MSARLTDWWRGYSDVDLAVARFKVQLMRMWPAPGGVTLFTAKEMQALRANSFAGRAGLI